MGDEGRPAWWERNAAYKRQLDIPAYEPPRFADGAYTHEVVGELEDAHACIIRFVGRDSRYPEDWQVHVDGTPAFDVGRHRDENGNTVYEMDAAEFAEAIADWLSGGSRRAGE